MPGISGETIPRGSAVYMAAADGYWYLADANVAAALPAMGISAEGASVAGRRFQILVLGLMSRNDWAWTRGDPIYISDVAGVLTQTDTDGATGAVCVSAGCGCHYGYFDLRGCSGRWFWGGGGVSYS